MHVGAAHVSDNFSSGLVHNFYEGVVVHLMEGGEPRMNSAASFINKVFFLQWHVRNMIGSYGEKRKQLHYIHSKDGPAYTVACWGCSLHTLSHKTTVATSLTSRRITSAWGRGGCLV